jgi:hypothetical protein
MLTQVASLLVLRPIGQVLHFGNERHLDPGRCDRRRRARSVRTRTSCPVRIIGRLHLRGETRGEPLYVLCTIAASGGSARAQEMPLRTKFLRFSFAV